MGKRRPSGDGMVRKRPDGRWEGRIVVGHKADGSSIFRYLYADTQKELTELAVEAAKKLVYKNDGDVFDSFLDKAEGGEPNE